MRKIVDLPAAAEENLRQVLAFEMDRLTPFAAEAVHYDVHVMERDVENRRIRAELMVLPRAAVEPSLQLLQRIGLKPDVVALPRGLHERVPWRLPLASNGASGRRRIVYRLPTALLATAALLLAAGVYVAFNKQRAQIEALEREVAGARKEAEDSRRLQKRSTAQRRGNLHHRSKAGATSDRTGAGGTDSYSARRYLALSAQADEPGTTDLRLFP